MLNFGGKIYGCLEIVIHVPLQPDTCVVEYELSSEMPYELSMDEVWLTSKLFIAF